VYKVNNLYVCVSNSYLHIYIYIYIYVYFTYMHVCGIYE